VSEDPTLRQSEAEEGRVRWLHLQECSVMASMCPFCHKHASAAKPLWPFCSERCKTADLGNWAKEEYRIAGSRLDEDLLDDLDLLEEDQLDSDVDLVE